eukprot:SM000395S15204  [mRNA]  locus=s395:17849:19346:+ [translate_table: standard]
MSSASVPITLAVAALLLKIASRASASMSAECARGQLAHRYSVLWGLRAAQPRTLVSQSNVCAALRTRVAAFAPPAALLASRPQSFASCRTRCSLAEKEMAMVSPAWTGGLLTVTAFDCNDGTAHHRQQGRAKGAKWHD